MADLASDLDPLLGSYADQLAQLLNRTTDDIRQHGLGDGDFRDQRLDLSFADGSSASFNAAFFVVSADQQWVAIFTQNCGYFELATSELYIDTVARTVFPGGYAPDA
jgi:hypothetical protein